MSSVNEAARRGSQLGAQRKSILQSKNVIDLEQPGYKHIETYKSVQQQHPNFTSNSKLFSKNSNSNNTPKGILNLDLSSAAGAASRLRRNNTSKFKKNNGGRGMGQPSVGIMDSEFGDS